ncbi:MAG TPA: SDR family oxidoreductase [Bryobacteraceae bacterium]|nr:SDR family oxidoreductase [Bryobacteraceae bacterium]
MPATELPANPLDLTGSTVLVTGASSGIGRDTAILLSSLGARVAITGRNAERLERTMASLSGQGHRMEVFDLSCAEQIPQWMRKITAEMGPLNGVVHAAGKQIASPARFTTPQNVDDILRTNLHSAIHLARGLCHRSCHGKESSIVFLSSVMGLVGRPGVSLYAASKAALMGFTKSLAVELAPERIRVNCIAPAFVETEMLAEVREWLSAGELEALEKAHPLGFGAPRDVANAAAFLISDMSRWITGTTLVVDGGYSAQ